MFKNAFIMAIEFIETHASTFILNGSILALVLFFLAFFDGSIDSESVDWKDGDATLKKVIYPGLSFLLNQVVTVSYIVFCHRAVLVGPEYTRLGFNLKLGKKEGVVFLCVLGLMLSTIVIGLISFGISRVFSNLVVTMLMLVGFVWASIYVYLRLWIIIPIAVAAEDSEIDDLYDSALEASEDEEGSIFMIFIVMLLIIIFGAGVSYFLSFIAPWTLAGTNVLSLLSGVIFMVYAVTLGPVMLSFFYLQKRNAKLFENDSSD